MRTKPIEYADSALIASLVVREADLEVGQMRRLLRMEGQAQAQPAAGSTIAKVMHNYLHVMVYPDLMAATTGTIKVVATGEVLVLPVAYDQYAHLPASSDFEIAWENAVYELNPNWILRPTSDNPADAAELAAEKKGVMSSTAASRPSTRRSKGKK